MINALSFTDFGSAARAVLGFLHRRLGFDLWMVTRTAGDDWIVLQCEDHGYGVEPGTVFRWADSFCSEMVKGNGPRIAPRSNIVPAYAAAPISRDVRIEAYIGLPLVRADGSLFGTLCAINPSAQPEWIVNEQELLELLSASLSTILQGELSAAEEARRSQKLAAEALTDALTHIYNRRGWERLLDAEDNRCRRYGHSAVVIIVDLNGLKLVNDTQGHAAGDALIVRTATALRQAARSNDVLARLGGDEFAILGAECDQAGADALIRRVRSALADGKINASIGHAMRDPKADLRIAWESADQAMYEEKRSRAMTRALKRSR